MSNFNFKWQCPISILNGNVQFQLEMVMSNFNWKWQCPISIGNGNVQFQLEMAMSNFNWKRQYPTTIGYLFYLSPIIPAVTIVK